MSTHIYVPVNSSETEYEKVSVSDTEGDIEPCNDKSCYMINDKMYMKNSLGQLVEPCVRMTLKCVDKTTGEERPLKLTEGEQLDMFVSIFERGSKSNTNFLDSSLVRELEGNGRPKFDNINMTDNKLLGVIYIDEVCLTEAWLRDNELVKGLIIEQTDNWIVGKYDISYTHGDEYNYLGSYNHIDDAVSMISKYIEHNDFDSIAIYCYQ